MSGALPIGSCFFYGEEMNEDVINSVSLFERNNGIKIENYYSRKRPKDKFAIKDNYVGEDVFLERIEEWLEICSKKIERKYLLQLLNEYLYFPKDKFDFEVERIIDCLREDQVDLKRALFVTFSSKKGTASGGDSISSALTVATMGISVKENIITDVERATKTLMERIRQYKYIVFVDDVIGSGMTLNTNVSAFFKRFEFDENVIVYIAALCGRKNKIDKKAKQFTKRYNKEFRSILLYPLKKSLDEYDKSDKSIRYEVVSIIENKIDKYALEEKEKTFFLGFEKNQLLVSFYYNTPNNTLSLFWRPSEISVPLFTRTSYKRPTIDDCRKNKQKLQKNAYERGKHKK